MQGHRAAVPTVTRDAATSAACCRIQASYTQTTGTARANGAPRDTPHECGMQPLFSLMHTSGHAPSSSNTPSSRTKQNQRPERLAYARLFYVNKQRCCGVPGVVAAPRHKPALLLPMHPHAWHPQCPHRRVVVLSCYAAATAQRTACIGRWQTHGSRGSAQAWPNQVGRPPARLPPPPSEHQCIAHTPQLHAHAHPCIALP